MSQKTIAAALVLSALGLASFACSGSASDEPSGSTSEGLTETTKSNVATACAADVEPLTYQVVTTTTVTVITPNPPSGSSSGSGPKPVLQDVKPDVVSSSTSTSSTGCLAATSAPVVPAGGFPDSVLQSCSDANGVPAAPPAELAGCTAGYTFPNIGSSFSLFLCPASIVSAVNAGTQAVPAAVNACSSSALSTLVPSDGCFGPPVDASWGYVEWSEIVRPFGGYDHGVLMCGFPGPGCGGNCKQP